jgi:hypothetical protein
MANNFGVGTASYGMAAMAGLTTLEDQKTQNDAILTQIEQEGEASIYRLGMTQEEIKEIDRELSSAMSQTEIQSLKDEAFAKAYTAESGLSGTSAKEVAAEATVSKAQVQTQQVAQAKGQQRRLLSTMFQEKQQYEQRTELLIEQMKSPTEAGLGAFSASMAGFQTGLGLFSQESQDKFLG